MTELEVSGLTISNPVTTGFTVSWTPPEMGQHVSGYTVQWRPKDNSVAGDSVDVGTATSYVINTAEVTAGQAYVITIVSRNDVTQQGSPRTITSLPKEQAASMEISFISRKDVRHDMHLILQMSFLSVLMLA